MEFLIILFLLVLNGIFAMYEIALVSSSKARLETLAGKGNKSARTETIGRTGKVLVHYPNRYHPYRYRIRCLWWGCHRRRSCSVLLSHTGSRSLCPQSGNDYHSSNHHLPLSYHRRAGTQIHCPQQSGTVRNSVQSDYDFIDESFLPVRLARLLNRIIGVKNEERPMTQEEIKMILHQSSEQGVIDKEETEMLRDVFRFSDKRANELMTHRRDLVIFHPDDTKDKVMKTIEEEHYSKYLLVDERKDEIIGVVSVKDIILMVGNKKEFNLREIARPPLFIPESLYANKILELFKKNKNKFGVVVNEYGSTEGIITLHDLTESIFGDILEEDEMEEEDIVRRQDGSMLVEASMNIKDFMEEMGILSYEDLEDEDFTTLGGLAMFLLGGIPKAGDIFTYKNLQFEVVDMDRGRVDKLLVIKRDEEA